MIGCKTNKRLGFPDANQAMCFLCEQSFPLTPRTTILKVAEILFEFFSYVLFHVLYQEVFCVQECWRIWEACEASQEQLVNERANSAKMKEDLESQRDICHRVRTQDRLHFVD